MQTTLHIALLLFIQSILFAQTKNITGIVSEENGSLPGAIVYIKGGEHSATADFDGKCAIQAGRELRVIVEGEKVNDVKAPTISFEISQKLQTDMTYPGQVKVTVIPEQLI